jgi:hypothetical protein
MMKRRGFLIAAATAPVAGIPVAAQTAHPACLPPYASIKTRAAAKIEVLYKTTHGQPNGLAVTENPNELWVLDQGADHWVTLTNIKDGSVIREFKADVVGPSGLCVDGDTMWITSTHNSIIVQCDIHTGKTIQKCVTPGAGRIYEREDDPAARSSPLKPAWPGMPRGIGPAQADNVGNNTGKGLKPGRLPLTAEEGSGGTGAHAIILDGDYLIYACPPARQIFTINKNTWKVKAAWPTPGNRTHGMSWGSERKTIWSSDSNLNAFYHHDAATGNIFERVQLPDDSPAIHGAKLVGEWMYFCDDMGWMARFKI